MKWVVLTSILAITLIAGVLFMFGPETGKQENPEKVRVAMIMAGLRNDHSWNESHYEAIQKAESLLDLDVAYYENVPLDSTAQDDMEEAISNGAKIVIANSFGYGAAEMAVARNHPEVKFFYATGLKTKTNEIGYVAGLNISEVNRGINAFALGVQKVNPEAKVFVSWTGSWTDESRAADSTRSLLENHNIDVLTTHLDALSPYDIADEKDVWIIGYNRDNSKRFPDRFLTAPVWHWENFYVPKIREVLQDKFEGRSYWLGLESGIMDLAEMTRNVDASIRQVVEDEKNRLTRGKFDVFYGPIEDNHGVIRVGEGESMTDDEMLNRFDWYGKGVVDGINP